MNETAHEPPTDEKDNINNAANLAIEATLINQSFHAQVVCGNELLQFPDADPFKDSSSQDMVPVGYRYRKWDLGDGISLVARTEIDSVLKYQGQDAFVGVHALNEFDPKVSGVDWRQKLDSQRGAVLATELKNNGSKLSRWTSQALLAGLDQIKLGFVSRVHPRDPSRHVILGTQIYKPREFAAQINFNVPGAWGALRTILQIVMKLPDGKYVLLKDPNKAVVRLYSVPANAFDIIPADDEELGPSDEDDSDALHD